MSVKPLSLNSSSSSSVEKQKSTFPGQEPLRQTKSKGSKPAWPTGPHRYQCWGKHKEFHGKGHLNTSNCRGRSVLKAIIELPHRQKCCMTNTRQCGSLKLAVKLAFCNSVLGEVNKLYGTGIGTDIAKAVKKLKTQN